MADRQRLFFALWPGEAERRRLVEAQSRAATCGGRPVPPARLHLTVLFLGSLDAAAAAASAAGAAAAAVSAAPFELALDRVERHGRAGVVWAAGPGAPGLVRLWQALGDRLRAAGVPHEERELLPHVTLYRQPRRGVRFALDPPLRWPARDFALVESRPAHAMSYRVITRWPLTG